MSQPPYPPPGSPDAGGDQSRSDVPGQAYEGPPPTGYAPYQGVPQYGYQPYDQLQPGYQQYGQPPYGQQYPQAGPYGAQVPPWGQGGNGSPSGSNRRTVVALAVGAAVVVAAIVVALVIGAGDDENGGSTLPDATSEPEGLGDDPDLDDLAEDCYDGDMQACDDLFQYSPGGSAYELYGGTCAGRQSNAKAHEDFCVDAFPPAS
jgi:hypothetical protein